MSEITEKKLETNEDELNEKKYSLRSKLIVGSIVSILLSGGLAYYLLQPEVVYRVWQPIVVNYQFSPEDSNPFLNYKMTGNFRSPDGELFVVPGYYDGNNAWSVKFTPDKEGEWAFFVELEYGPGIAIDYPQVVECYSGKINREIVTSGDCVLTSSLEIVSGGSIKFKPGTKVFIKNGSNIVSRGGALSTSDVKIIPYGMRVGFSGHSTSFRVGSKSGEGFFNSGTLVIDGKKFKTLGDGKRWIKGGSSSPENFLAHTNKIQMIEELAEVKANSLYMIMNNIGGDGDDSYPFASYNDRSRYDTEKLKDWELVFTAMQEKGICLHFVLGESEKENKLSLNEWQRKLYFREMIARFSHHNGILWNLCEEYNHHEYPIPVLTLEIWARQIKALDPYNHPVGVHNWNDEGVEVLLNNPNIDWLSVQYREDDHLNYLKDLNRRTSKPICLDESHHAAKDFPVFSGCKVSGWLKICSPEYMRDEIIIPAYNAEVAGVEIVLEEALSTSGYLNYKKVFSYLFDARSRL